MVNKQNTQLPAWSNELNQRLAEVSSTTLNGTLIGIVVFGLVLLGKIPDLMDATWKIYLVIGLFGYALGLWLLQRWNYSLAAWSLVSSTLVGIFFLVGIGKVTLMIFLIILPVGLAMLVLSRLAGIIVACLVTILIFFIPATIIPLDSMVKTICVLEVWVVTGLIWLTLHPLLQAVHWAWESYESGNEMLKQARDYQVQLFQALEELKSANIQLTRLNQLAQSLRSIAEEERQTKEQFVANVSHELRTPLNMIVGFCEMINENPSLYGGKIPSALLADLEVVLRNSQHLSSLVDDVLDLSQIDAGQTALIKERVALGEIISAATIAVRPLYDSKNLYLEVEIPDNLPLTLCDRTRIREVFLNLLSNAGRFSETGGVRIKVRQDDNQILVAVKDTGPGIAKEDQAKLFRPFQQLDGSIRRRFGGTGLGLSISKQFIELHGGKMWVESIPGEGANFIFTLPIDPPQPPLDRGALRWLNPYQPDEKPHHLPRLTGRELNPRVVVVEKGKQIQRLFHRYFDGVEVIPAPDIENALKELAAVPSQALMINAVSVDETIQELQSTGQLPYGVPTIIFSMPEMGSVFNKLGVVDYLVKPISNNTLLGAIDNLNCKVKTILVVDDEPDALQLFRRMLTNAKKGFRVLRASDGKQALEILQSQKPDLILLDLVMPEMDGFQLLAIKEADKNLRQIPVLLISARDFSGHPIVSNTLTVTCRDGVSMQQLLSSIDALSSILSKGDRSGGLKQKEASVC